MAGLFLKVIERIGWWWYIAIPRTPPTPSAQWSNNYILAPALKKQHRNKYSPIFLCGEYSVSWYLQTVSFSKLFLHFPSVQWPTCLQPSRALFYQYQGCRVVELFRAGQSEDSIVTHLTNQSVCGIYGHTIKEHQDPRPQKCSESREKENDVIIGVAHNSLQLQYSK